MPVSASATFNNLIVSPNFLVAFGIFIANIGFDFAKSTNWVGKLVAWFIKLVVEFTDSSYYEIINGQTNAVVIPGQLTSEYNDCPI